MRDPFSSYDQWKTASPYDEEMPCEVCGKWSDVCECPECPECGEVGNPACTINKDAPAFGHDAALALMDELSVDGLYGIYRSVYKYTPCGPTIGFQVEYIVEQDNGDWGPESVADELVARTIYCDDLLLPLEGTPYRLNRNDLTYAPGDMPSVVVTGVSVGSIVEGVDQETQTIVLDRHDFTSEAFWAAVETVDQEANDIWNETHGCESCANHWHSEDVDAPWGNEPEFQGNDANTPVWDSCPDCSGNGVIV